MFIYFHQYIYIHIINVNIYLQKDMYIDYDCMSRTLRATQVSVLSAFAPFLDASVMPS